MNDLNGALNLISNCELRRIAISACMRIERAFEGVEYFKDPFKHVVIDNFMPEDLAELCLREFPALDQHTWEISNDLDIEVKYRSRWQSEFEIPNHISAVTRIMNSALFLRAASHRLSIPKLLSDPYFSGGGLNVTTKGGLLDVHVDGNYHDATGLHRRANAIWYLNPGWHPEWGGEFGLYINEGTTLVKKIPPLHNRLVLFDSHDHSYHGLPDPVNFPAEQPRRSVILYYYTVAARPNSQVTVSEPHSALWVKRGLLDKRGAKTRKFT